MDYVLLTLAFIAYALFGYNNSEEKIDKIHFAFVCISGCLTFIGLKFLSGYWDFIGLGRLSVENLTSIYQLQIILSMIFMYCVASTLPISYCAWKRGGFDRITFNEGILGTITYGGLLGLGLGLGLGIFLGLISAISNGILYGTLQGLIMGTYIGLAIGFVAGAGLGIRAELNKEEVVVLSPTEYCVVHNPATEHPDN